MATVTIHVDDDLLSRARQFAKARGTTVEEMVERYMHVLSLPPLAPEEMSPSLRRVSGIMPAMSDQEVERVLDQHRTQKYGRP